MSAHKRTNKRQPVVFFMIHFLIIFVFLPLVMFGCSKGSSVSHSPKGNNGSQSSPVNAVIDLNQGGFIASEHKVAEQLTKNKVSSKDLYSFLRERIVSSQDNSPNGQRVRDRLSRLEANAKTAGSLQNLNRLIYQELFRGERIRHEDRFNSIDGRFGYLNKFMKKLLYDGIYNKEAMTELTLMLSLKMETIHTVVIYEKGRRIPGYMVKVGKDWRLYGFEESLLHRIARVNDYGLSRQLDRAIRVVRLMDDLSIRGLSHRILNINTVEGKALQNTAKDFNIPIEKTENKVLENDGYYRQWTTREPFRFGSLNLNEGSAFGKNQPFETFIRPSGETIYLQIMDETNVRDIDIEDIEERVEEEEDLNVLKGNASLEHLTKNRKMNSDLWFDYNYGCDLLKFECKKVKKQYVNPFMGGAHLSADIYALISLDFKLSSLDKMTFMEKDGRVISSLDAYESYEKANVGCLLRKGKRDDLQENTEKIRGVVVESEGDESSSALIGYPAKFSRELDKMTVNIPTMDLRFSCKGVKTVKDFLKQIPKSFIKGIALD